MFDGFDEGRLALDHSEVYYRQGGSGPPVLLLHGFPQTHAAWHRVAPLLASRYTVIVPDLRGYGRSTGPAPDAAHDHYSKRAMAQDVLALMRSLGFPRFFLAGHDRGARVGYRLALDVPESVAALAPIDIVPTIEMWDRMGMAGALRSYHWAFLAQPAPMPETLIGADPRFYLHHLLRRWAGDFGAIEGAALADYERSFAQPATVVACCEDYRAGATVDVAHDRADRDAGRKLTCPVLAMWAIRYLSSQSPLATWQRWADDVREVALDCGHFVAEEQPQACAQALAEFFGAGLA
jgi:haloacetate dehalogenase